MSDRKRVVIFILLILSVFIALFSAGCTSQTVTADVHENNIPKTPQEAGIKTVDSTSCEGCHLDPEVISSFEKPHSEGAGGETEGG